MRGMLATIATILGIAGEAAAQLAPLPSTSAPAPFDGLPAIAATGERGERDAPSADDATRQRCEAWAREFRVRNTWSPSQRQGALEACLAAARRARVDVAGP